MQAATRGEHGLRHVPEGAMQPVVVAGRKIGAARVSYSTLSAIAEPIRLLGRVLDAWSRKVVGYAIGNTMETQLHAGRTGQRVP